ncbi:hypothetical protein CEY02_17880 [Bacillus pumilus]|uniref:Uncharacterized protein n=1 Tax=Bacillus pumilus TaxID=1408 RepID=A0A2A5IPK7_BACPU|nr:hypothetical protein CEY02_17880 [Bacillus pumilus]PIK27071.1 hypothetical protein CTV99_08635 [Bacillus pumilus]
MKNKVAPSLPLVKVMLVLSRFCFLEGYFIFFILFQCIPQIKNLYIEKAHGSQPSAQIKFLFSYMVNVQEIHLEALVLQFEN